MSHLNALSAASELQRFQQFTICKANVARRADNSVDISNQRRGLFITPVGPRILKNCQKRPGYPSITEAMIGCLIRGGRLGVCSGNLRNFGALHCDLLASSEYSKKPARCCQVSKFKISREIKSKQLNHDRDEAKRELEYTIRSTGPTLARGRHQVEKHEADASVRDEPSHASTSNSEVSGSNGSPGGGRKKKLWRLKRQGSYGGELKPFNRYWGSAGEEGWTQGVGTGALEKLKEFETEGTFGGEKLKGWARKKLLRGYGWRMKAAVKEFSLWEIDSMKEEAVLAREECNMEWEKDPAIELGVTIRNEAPRGAALEGVLSKQNSDASLVGKNDVDAEVPHEWGQATWLKRGKDIPHLQGAVIHQDRFIRSYEILALRVAVEECSQLVKRLEAHLLNWPRVKNVGRVKGDDGPLEGGAALLRDVLDQELDQSSGPAPAAVDDSVRSAIYGGGQQEISGTVPAIRETEGSEAERKGTKKKRGRLHTGPQFSSSIPEGLNSRNPKRGFGQQQELKPRSSVQGQVDKDEQPVDLEVLEVLRSSSSVDPGEGDGLGKSGLAVAMLQQARKTRLVLLEEQLLGKAYHELPAAVQAVIDGAPSPDGKEALRPSARIRKQVDLVRCLITLNYDYWSMEEVLLDVLPAGMAVPSSFETIGHIAHLNLREEHRNYRHLIAQVILEKHRPRVLSIVNKTDAIHSKYRTMKLELLAGSPNLVTTVVENGLRFKVDFSRVYWNSRLATERRRLMQVLNGKDIVCDMFAGVGPFSVAAAKKVKKVYANDLNPSALTYLAQNVYENGVASKVELSNQDGRQFIQGLLAHNQPVYFTQVVMNLPTDAAEFLDAFKGTFSVEKWGTHPMPCIHVYGFSKAEDPEAEFCERIEKVLGQQPQKVTLHRVRMVAPNKWMLCASFVLPAQVAFGAW